MIASSIIELCNWVVSDTSKFRLDILILLNSQYSFYSTERLANRIFQIMRDKMIDQDTLKDLTESYLKLTISNACDSIESEFDSSTPFGELGINSFDVLKIIKSLETSFGSLPKTLLFENFHVNDLSNYFVNKHKQTLLDKVVALNTQLERTENLVEGLAQQNERSDLRTISHEVEQQASGKSTFIGEEESPIIVLEKDLDIGSELSSEIYAIFEEYKNETSVSRGTRNIAPFLFIGSQKRGYFNFSRSIDTVLVYAYTGPDDYVNTISSEFLQYCEDNNFEFNMFSDSRIEQIDGIQFSATPFGVVQKVHSLERFTLQGGKMRRLRYQVSKFEKSGSCKTIEYIAGTEHSTDQNIAEVIDQWCESRTMVNPLIYTVKDEILSGNLSKQHRLFLTYLNDELQNVILISSMSSQGTGYLMDLEFYPKDMPLGGLEFAIVKMVEILVAEGCDLLSLGGTYGCKLEESPNTDPQIDKMLADLREQNVFNDDGNFQFKNKFRPKNETIYLCRPIKDDNADNVIDIIMMIAQPPEIGASNSTFPSTVGNKRAVVERLPVSTIDNNEHRPSDQSIPSFNDTKDLSSEILKNLAGSHYNPLNISAEQIPNDLKTDSWAQLSMLAIDNELEQLYGRLQHPIDIDSSLRTAFPFKYFSLCQSGREAERVLCKAWQRKGIVLQNMLFPTWIFNQIESEFSPIELPLKEAFRLDSQEVYKSNLDIEMVRQQLEVHKEKVAFVCIEVSNNAVGGLPVSIDHLSQLKTLLKELSIPLFLDATRILENAHFIVKHDPNYANAKVWEVVHTILSFADVITVSLAKDFSLNKGGLIATNDKELFHRTQNVINQTGGGLDVIDKKLVAIALKNQKKIEVSTARRIANTRLIWQALDNSNVPVVKPVGGHCILIDVKQIAEFKSLKSPVASFVAWLYLNTGIRCGEHSVGMQRDSSLNGIVRLAVPIGLQMSQVEKTIEQLLISFSRIENIPNLEKVNQKIDSFGAINVSYRLINIHNQSSKITESHSGKEHLDSSPSELQAIENSSDDKNTITQKMPQTDKPVNPAFHYENPRNKNSGDEIEIAVIGMAGRYPKSTNMQEFWDNLVESKNCISDISENRFNRRRQSRSSNRYRGGFIDAIDKFDSLFFNIAPREAETLDPQERLFLEVAWETLEDAGYYPENLVNSKGESKIGVFVGAVWAMYQTVGAEERLAGNEQAIASSFLWSIANRVSYCMNFSGPSIAVDTACSASLTALYLGVESIRKGESSEALIGGVNLDVHQCKQEITVAGGLLSEDGLCRTFGKAASGYVPGEGIGAIFIKPLECALADHDNVYGVIKSIAINHGGRTSGFSVPNPKAQCELVRTALKSADIDARTLGYIEAHGTGTELGDPIEITGLRNAFEDYGVEKQTCSIGSIKTNIGHLEAAAGLVGMCKVLLQMKHRKLVPSLHSTELNEFIDFDDSPFVVQQSVEEWKAKTIDGIEYPLRAGISSFGAGGSNAHVILESIPLRDTNEQAAAEISEQLFPLSARNEEQLRRAVERLKTFLTQSEREANGLAPINIKDVAYTLQVGRKSFVHRLVLVAKTKRELVERLDDYIEGKTDKSILSGCVKNNEGITKLLSRKEKEQFIQLVSQGRDPHKIAQLWVDGLLSDWQGMAVQADANRISLPTYPFADKRHWITKKEDSSNFYGSDILLAKHPLIDTNESTFERQIFKKTFTENEFFIYDHLVSGIPTLPGVGYLDLVRKAGEIAAGRKIQKIINILWVSPLTVENSTPTEAFVELKPNGSLVQFEVFSEKKNGDKQLYAQGKLAYATSEQLHAEPEYVDIKNIRNRCKKVIEGKEAYPLFNSLGLNLGPSFQVLQEVYKNDTEVLGLLEIPTIQNSQFHDYVLHPSIIDGSFQALMGAKLGDEQDGEMVVPYSLGEVEVLHPLTKTCYSYVTEATGKNKSGSGLSKKNVLIVDEDGKVLIKIRDSVGVSLTDVHEKPKQTSKGDLSSNDFEKLYYENVWDEQPVDGDRITDPNLPAILLFDTDEVLYKLYLEKIDKVGGDKSRIILVVPGDNYKKTSNFAYEIDPKNPQNFEQLFESLSEQQWQLENICFAWPTFDQRDVITSNVDKSQETSLDFGVYAFLNLSQAIIRLKLSDSVKIQYLFLTNAQDLQPVNQAVIGFTQILVAENPKLNCQVLQIHQQEASKNHVLLDSILTEIQLDGVLDLAVKYENQKRLIRKISKFELARSLALDSGSNSVLKTKGVYLITGGAGGLGFIFAEYLATEFKARLVLTGRSKLSPENETKLKEMRELGAEVVYFSADISKFNDVQRVVKQTKSLYGEINGIVHSAGVLRDSYVRNKTFDEMKAVFAPKVYGTLHLDDVTADEKLDFFVSFSSLAALAGNAGQSDYSFANHFMDSFMQSREIKAKDGNRYGKSLSLNWSIWADGGMQLDEQTAIFFEKNLGIKSLSKQTGIDTFSVGLTSNKSNFAVIEGVQEKIERAWGLIEDEPKMERASQSSGSDSNIAPTSGATTGNELTLAVEQALSNIVKEFLKLDEEDIDLDTILLDLGYDSIGLTTFANAVNDIYDTDVTPVLFFEYPNIREIANFLATEHKEQASKIHQTTASHGDNTSNVNERSQETIAEQALGNVVSISKSWNPDSIEQSSKITANPNQLSPDSRFVQQPIAIVGMSGVMPQADNLEEYWEKLRNAENNMVTEIPKDRWDWQEYYGDPLEEENKTKSKWGGFMREVDKFDPLFWGISPLEAQMMDPQQRLFLESAWGAVEDSGQRVSDLAGTKTGLFVGASTRDYIDLMADEKAELNGYSASGTSHAVLANRVSFLLGLHGPSAPLDTACSSSLVALHRAIESIHTGSSDMAIVGGVQVMLTPAAFISFGAAGMLAADGRCKTFDERGDGYVRGEGTGAIFIKPLAMAQVDGNSIYAIIKATAENHGGRATMLTAPNPQAQAELLVEAYHKAQIDPTTVGYIECHGTGTSLGDPIEIQAMKKAFTELYKKHNKAPPQKPHIGLTSVKTNIGHLETAAGIAGILKVLLSIKNREIPALLHFEKQNPFIKLENTPFYLVDKTQPWEAAQDEKGNSLPLRAGISSFGFGGANAHIILEEYVGMQNKAKLLNKGPMLFLLSAKSEERLSAYAKNMLNHIQSQSNRLIDIVYTSQVGRNEMVERLAVVVNSVDELTEKLAAFIKGDRYIDGLFVEKSNSKSAAKDFDTAILENWINTNNITDLAGAWTKGAIIDWNSLYTEIKPNRISLPSYPFTRQRCWFSSPKQKEDHTEQNLSLATTNLSILHPLVHRNVSTLMEQKFSSQFSGSEFFFSDHVGGGQKLLPGVAYMEMIRAAGELAGGSPVQTLKNIIWMRPLVVDNEEQQVEILLVPSSHEVEFEVRNSTNDEAVTLCTGKLSYEHEYGQTEVLDVEEIKRRCSNQPLTKSELYSYISSQGLDLGRGFQVSESLYASEDEALSVLKLPQHLVSQADKYWLHPALMDGAVHSTMVGLVNQSKNNISLGVPFSVGEVQIFGSLEKLYYGYATWSDEKPKNNQSALKLNQYLLDRHGKVLVKIKGFVGKTLQPAQEVTVKDMALESTGYGSLNGQSDGKLTSLIPVWNPVKLTDYPAVKASPQTKILVVADNANQYEWFKSSYPKARRLNIKLNSSVEQMTRELNNCDFETLVWIAPDLPRHLEQNSTSDRQIIAEQERGVLSVFRLTKSLIELDFDSQNLQWTIITNKTQKTTENEFIQPTHAGVLGLVGSMAKEFPLWNLRLLDIDSLSAVSAIECLSLPCDKQGNNLVNRNGEWFRQGLAQLNSLPDSPPIYKQNGVYLVIGGAGGLGEVWSRFMIEQYQAKIIWIGRRKPDSIIEDKISSLAKLGTAPLYISADATNLDSLQSSLQTTLSHYAEINGVVQSAIVLKDESLLNLDEVGFRASLSAKVDISVNMNLVFGSLPLDFMVFFSSIISFMKTPHQSNYAAGCTFKDSFAQRLQQQHAYPVKTINWGYWGNVGIVADDSYKKVMEQIGVGSIEPEEGMQALNYLLSADINHMALVKTLDQQALADISLAESINYSVNLDNSVLSEIESSLLKNLQDNRSLKQQHIALDDEAPNSQMVDLISEILAASLTSIGIFRNGSTQLAQLDINKTPADYYEKWLLRSISYLQQQNILGANLQFEGNPRKLEELWKEWESNKSDWSDNSNQQAQMTLLESCLKALPAILSGEKPATSILFPNASMELVEGIYRDNVIADYFNEILAETLVSFIEKHRIKNKGQPIRILEIGAGTGGTTANLLPLLVNYDIAEYCYTDLSKAFLMYAEQHFQPQYPIITTEIFDVSKPLASQSIKPNQYDIVIATNVLHATPNIRETLRNSKAALKNGGVLLLNEISNWSFYTHLTFGLLEGWWLHEDTNLRIPGNPGLESNKWKEILENEGFDTTLFPAESAHQFGQQIIAASSNGVVRQRLVREKLTVNSSKLSNNHSILPEPNENNLSNMLLDNNPDRLVSTTSHTGPDYIRKIVIAKLSESLRMDIDLIQNEASFFDYGVDSIVGVSLIRTISEALKIELETTSLFENSTVNQLTSYIWKNWQETIASQLDQLSQSEKTISEHREIGDSSVGRISEQSVTDHIHKSVVQSLSDSLKMEKILIRPDESFFDYGVDSIVGVSLIRRIADSLQIELETTVLFENSSVNQLSEFIYRNWHSQITNQMTEATAETSEVMAIVEVNKSLSEQPRIMRSRFEESRPSSNDKNLTSESQLTKPFQPIAIIGMSGKVAAAESLSEFWTSLKQGNSLVKDIQRWQKQECISEGFDIGDYCSKGGFLNDIDLFDAEFFRISEQEATYMCPQQRLFLEESWKALEDAGYAGTNTSGMQCGVYAGCTDSEYSDHFTQPPSHVFWGTSESIIPARVSYYLNLHGPAVAVDTACSSSIVAIHLACQSLWSGETTMAIAGGVSMQVSPGYYQVANLAGMLSNSGQCYTFDNRADGFVPAEAVGVLVLKPLQTALTDRDHIHAVIAGIGVNQDGTSNGLVAPNARAQQRLQSEVYKRFDIDPENIQLVEAHGTGTQLGDTLEFNAISRTFHSFTSKQQYCAIGSVKTNVGHAGPAAGITGLLKLILSLKHKQIPATLNYEQSNEAIKVESSPFYINTELSEWKVKDGQKRTAALSSFGFSGTNAHLVLEEAPTTDATVESSQAKLVVISAESSETLRQQAIELFDYLQNSKEFTLNDISFTLMTGRVHRRHRMACIVSSKDELSDQLNHWINTGMASGVFTSTINEDKIHERVSLKKFGEHCIKQCQNTDNVELYLESLETIVDLYMQGYSLDYVKLCSEKSKRVPLPITHLSPRKYWIDQKPIKQIHHSENLIKIHPMLHKIQSDLQQPQYLTYLNGNELFIANHRVDGNRIITASVYLELINAAISHAFPKQPNSEYLELYNIIWSEPIVVNGETNITINLSTQDTKKQANDSIDIEFKVFSPTGIHCQGKALRRPVSNPRVIELELVKSGMKPEQTIVNRIYSSLSNRSLEYDESHRAITTVFVGKNEIVADLELPCSLEQSFDEYFLHPVLLDSALQASVSLGDLNHDLNYQPSSPISVESMNVLAKFSKAMTAWIRYVDDESSANIIKIDIDMFDDSNKLCLQLRGVTYEKVKSDESVGTKTWWKFYSNSKACGTNTSSLMSPSPFEKIMLLIKQELAYQLEQPIHRIDTKRTFFDLGIDSVGMTSVLNEINRLLKTSVQPSIIFEHSNVELLAKYLVDSFQGTISALAVERLSFPIDYAARIDVGNSALPPIDSNKDLTDQAIDGNTNREKKSVIYKPKELLVAMQTGSNGESIFAVPGVGGSVLTLQAFSLAFAKSNPFFGLQTVNVDNQVFAFDSIEDMAVANIAAIKTNQNVGPYHLVGYSFGGVVAFEMARQLAIQGDRVATLTLVDTLVPTLFDGLNSHDEATMLFEIYQIAMRLLGASLELSELKKIPVSERSNYILSQLSEQGITVSGEQSSLLEVIEKNGVCQSNYRPGKLPGNIPVTLYRGTERYADMQPLPDDYGWNEFLDKKLTVVDILANHSSIMNTENASKIAKKVKTLINKKETAISIAKK